MEDNRERLAGIAAQALNISEPPASAPSGPQASHVQPQPGRRQGPQIPVGGLLHPDTHQRAAPPTSQPGAPMAIGNLITADQEPVHHLTNTTRNMSITTTAAQAPSGVGPGIGGHGEQHFRPLFPHSLPPGPAQPKKKCIPSKSPTKGAGIQFVPALQTKKETL